nr:DUF4340 domain-containing protein [Pseudobdellovibrionaceae bacterium]
MKNRGLWFLIGLILILGGVSFWDVKNETQKEEKKKVESQLITLDKDQISEIQITTPQWSVLLKRSNEGWDVAEPLKDEADPKMVEELLTAVTDEKSTDQVAEGDSIDWKVYGLDQPKGSIRFKNTAGESQELQISNLQNFEFNAYVKKGSETKVLTASSAWQTKLDKKVNDYRNKSLFRHKISRISQVLIENKSGQIKLEKNLNEKNQNEKDLNASMWILPENKDWVLDPSLVKELLDSLKDAHINELVKENVSKSELAQVLKTYGLDKPLAKLSLKFENSEELKEDSSSEKNAEKNISSWAVRVTKMKEDHYAYIENGNTIYKLDPVSLSNVINAEAIKLRDPKLPFKVNVSSTHKIELSTGLKKFNFTKKGTAWELSESKENFNVNAENLNKLLKKIEESKVAFYEAKNSKISKMDNQLVLKDDQDKEVFSLNWSSAPIKKNTKSYYIAKSSLMSDAFALDESTIHGYSLTDLVVEKK